jgi:hypothetical protein
VRAVQNVRQVNRGGPQIPQHAAMDGLEFAGAQDSSANVCLVRHHHQIQPVFGHHLYRCPGSCQPHPVSLAPDSGVEVAVQHSVAVQQDKLDGKSLIHP